MHVDCILFCSLVYLQWLLCQQDALLKVVKCNHGLYMQPCTYRCNWSILKIIASTCLSLETIISSVCFLFQGILSAASGLPLNIFFGTWKLCRLSLHHFLAANFPFSTKLSTIVKLQKHAYTCSMRSLACKAFTMGFHRISSFVFFVNSKCRITKKDLKSKVISFFHCCTYCSK